MSYPKISEISCTPNNRILTYELSHPCQAAELFPMMHESELDELAADIGKHGLREPIKLFSEMILDGRNRLKACELATVEPYYIELPTEINPYDYVWSENAERRHLKEGMRGAIFVNYAKASDAWQQERQRIIEEANRQRSQAVQERPRTSAGTFETSDHANHSESEVEPEYSSISTSSEPVSSGASINAPLDTKQKSSKKSKPSKQKNPNRKTSAKKAKVAGCSPKTIERAEQLAANRPDLHARVCSGELSLNAAVRQMQRETPKAAIASTEPRPSSLRLYVALAQALPLPNACVDIIITSPPYNIGPKGGKPEQRDSGQSVNGGRAWAGIEEEKRLPEAKYQGWQLDVLKELFRVAKPGASLFYNHKVRQQKGVMIHPMEWLLEVEGWTLRQEIIWDRGSTHNHEKTLFWPHDERIYWLTNGKPRIPKEGIGKPTVWSFHGPVSDTWHVSTFPEELPKRCLAAIGAQGKIVLDPFGGSMTVCKVALEMGAAQTIGCDKNSTHIHRAIVEHGWKE